MTKMLSSIHAKKFVLGIAAATIVLGAYGGSLAQTGTVHLNVVNGGFIVSTGSGTGTLDYQGRTYQLRVSTTSFGTLGAAGGAFVGSAYNMRTAADIAGTYRSVGVGLTVGGGAGVARFQNTNGVTLDLVGVQAGLEVSLGSTEMTIALQ